MCSVEEFNFDINVHQFIQYLKKAPSSGSTYLSTLSIVTSLGLLQILCTSVSQLKTLVLNLGHSAGDNVNIFDRGA